MPADYATPVFVMPAPVESSGSETGWQMFSGFFFGLASSFAIGFTITAKRMYDGMKSSGDSLLTGAHDNLELGMLPGRAGVPEMALGAVKADLRQRPERLYKSASGKVGNKPAPGSAIKAGDIGTTRPLGVYDPLQLMTKNPEKYRRFQEMEIKHGRMSMLACTHAFVTGAGFRWPGYCSYLSFPPIKFSDIPSTPIAAWEALPQAGWAQIVALIAIIDNSLFRQDPDRMPGDVFGDRLPLLRPKYWENDPKTLEFNLNAERNNGRAAMMGILGMIIHEKLTGNPFFPSPITL